MIPYILYATGITTICFFFYKLLLQKETFYRWNRWMLLGCLAVSFVLPLLPAPREWSWRLKAKLAPEEKVAVQPSVTSVTEEPMIMPVVPEEKVKTAPVRPKREKKRAVAPVAASATDRPVVADIKPALPHMDGQVSRTDSAETGFLFSAAVVLRWIFYVYCFGVVFFGANFLLQLVILLVQSYANPVIRDGRFRIIEMGGNRAPCSFGNTIFINPANYDWETYNQILIHEKTHVSGCHTIDILLAETAVVLQWFNPFAWMYRREVENNLEFLTDEAVLLHREVERSAYQLSLLRVSAPHLPFSITNNYNQSLLKRRIVMMNSKPSSRRTVWKYFSLFPIFTGMVCLLNEPLAYGQTTKPVQPVAAKKAVSPAAAAKPAKGAKPAEPVPAMAPAPAAAPAVRAVTVSQEPDDQSVNAVQVQLNQVAANAQLENRQVAASYVNVAAATTLNNQLSTMVTTQSSLTPMPSVNIDLNGMNVFVDEITDGSWFVTSSDNKLQFDLRAEDEEHSWSNTLRVERSEINPFPGSGNVSFKLVREAGTMTFTGQFDGQQGMGHFHFQADDDYYKALQQMGVEEMDGHRKLSFFVLNLKKDYANMVLHNGYPHISSRNLISFAALKIDQEYIQYWRNSGIADVDEPRILFTLKSMKIDKAYVEEIKAAGYDHLTSRELSSLKSMKIDGAYIRSMGRGKDNEPIPLNQLISYKSMKIDADYLKSFQDLGYKELSSREVIQFKSQGITPEYVKSLRDQGLKELSVRDIVQFKAMKISPEFVKGFRDIGYNDISLSRLSTLKAMGITPEYVAEFKKLGFKDIPLNMLTSLKSTGVNADYISKMRERGFVSDDLNKYIRLKRDFE